MNWYISPAKIRIEFLGCSKWKNKEKFCFGRGKQAILKSSIPVEAFLKFMAEKPFIRIFLI
jgi:hypothetical protein